MRLWFSRCVAMLVLAAAFGAWLFAGSANAVVGAPQSALKITSKAGTYGTPLTLATSGGSGSGAVTTRSPMVEPHRDVPCSSAFSMSPK